MVSIVDTECWAPTVGRFMLAFGSIEASVSGILQLWCSDEQWRSVSDQKLGQRVAFLCDVLEGRDLNLKAKRVLRQNLSEVMRLAKMRNLIGHNPLMLALFEVEDSSSVFREAIISTRNEDKLVTLDDLQHQLAQVEALEDAITQNAAAIKLHGKSLPHLGEGLYQAVLDRPTKG